MSGIGGRAPATCAAREGDTPLPHSGLEDRKSTRLNSSHSQISYAVFCLKKKKQEHERPSEVAEHARVGRDCAERDCRRVPGRAGVRVHAEDECARAHPELGEISLTDRRWRAVGVPRGDKDGRAEREPNEVRDEIDPAHRRMVWTTGTSVGIRPGYTAPARQRLKSDN